MGKIQTIEKHLNENPKIRETPKNTATHKMSIPDINEIFSRKDELFLKMQEFLNNVN